MWIVERPAIPRDRAAQSIYSETGQRKRQHHRKSKNGCSSCKQRRIKCDEAKPSCAYCMKANKTCRYPPVSEAISSDRNIIRQSSKPASDAWLLNESVQGHLIRALENADKLDPELADFAPALRLHAIESLSHFVTCDLSWLKASKVQILMQKPATRLVINHQYLLHAVLAISNAHLAVLKPEQKSYDTSARLHWQHSMRLYAPRFTDGLETEDADAIYFASQLHAILSFLFVRLPLAAQGGRWTADWLVAMRYKWLLFRTPIVVERLRKGFWLPLVQAHYNWLERSDKQMAANEQNEISKEMCAVKAYFRSQGRAIAAFHEEQFEYLRMLERVPPIIAAIGAFLSFVTEAAPEYITSLQEMNTSSLLMLFYWTIIVGRVDQWWLSSAAKAEQRNLYSHLTQLADADLRRTLDILMEVDKDTP